MKLGANSLQTENLLRMNVMNNLKVKRGIISISTVFILSSSVTINNVSAATVMNTLNAGGSHTCGIQTDDSVTCWGNPGHGDGRTSPPQGSFLQVGGGATHSCGLRTNGTVVCWGDNTYVIPPLGGTFSQISTEKGSHVCGIRANGQVACWGSNSSSQSSPPGGTFSQVSAGLASTCGIRTNGSVACWGYNNRGQTQPPAGSFSQVSVGHYHACGIRTNGTIACWGDNERGQSTIPAGTFSQISASNNYNCGVRPYPDSGIDCWGANTHGKTSPPSGKFFQVTTGGDHACAVKMDGSVVCWGHNESNRGTSPSGLILNVGQPSINTTTISVPENQVTAGSIVATDPNGDPITFTITGGTDSGSFSITSSGNLTFNSAPNYESKSSYSVAVTATDNGNLTDTKTITVNVTNINEAPSITGEGISGSTTVGQQLTANGTFADPDTGDTAANGTLSYQWHTGTDNSCAGKTNISGATNSTYTLTNSEIGKYICVTITPKDDQNLAGTPVTATTSSSVPKLANTISFNNPGNKTYGDAPFALEATADSGLTVSYSTAPTSICTERGGKLTMVSAGDCTVIASQSGNDTYVAASNVEQTFTIAKKSITATVVNTNRGYGAANPSYTTSYNGLVNGDTAANIVTPPTVSTTADATSKPGDYVLTCDNSASADSNYTISSCNNGTLTIDKANTTIAISTDNPDPSPTGQAVMINVALTPASGNNPTGTVTINSDDGSCVASYPSETGCKIAFNTTGTKNITATYTGDDNYNGSTSSNETHAVSDLGVKITETDDGTNITETGVADTYTIQLFTVPSAAVKISIVPDSQCSVDQDMVTLNDVNNATITITANDDSDMEGNHTCTINHTITEPVGDNDYLTSMSISSITANVTDDDPGVLISQSSGNTTITEGGATDTYTVKLTTEPSDDVTIVITSDSQTGVDNSKLSFTNANWSEPQTVTVVAIDDAAVEGSHSSTINHNAISDDANYNEALFMVDSTVTTNLIAAILDNDNPPPEVEETPVSSNGSQPLPPTMGIYIKIGGSGTGTVKSSPAGINCQINHCETVSYKDDPFGIQCEPVKCSKRFETANWIDLTATAAPGSVFIGWGGHRDCVDNKLFLNGNRLCVAYFSLIHELTITTEGDGKVTSHDYGMRSTGINCGDGADKCMELFSSYTTTFLKAIPAKGSRFMEWSGDCGGVSNPLEIEVTEDKDCQAIFN